MKKYLLLGLAGLILQPVVSAQQSFEEWKQKNEAEFSDYQQIMTTGIAENDSAFQEFRDLYLQEYEDYRNEIERMWGEFRQRTQKEWVEYLDGGTTRIEVDFETGKGVVSIISDEPLDMTNDAELIQSRFLSAITTNGTELGYESDLPNPPISDGIPLLNDQLNKDEQQSDEAYSEAKVSEGIETTEVIEEDGVQRYIVMIDFELVPDHIERRARKISEIIYDFSIEYELDPPLVFAIIHTESFFNPVAVSTANAYGLMQLVPTSGGRDAYRAVFGKDGIPTQTFLFDPKNNINLGCAYVDILLRRYFKDVTAPITRSYLAISAYNTGAGNVYRAYDPENRSKSTAMARIATMTDEENYNYLVENLPYEETRNYLKKVVDRSKLYLEWSEQ
jgi:membrane-bound lytic murein transglycosylase C